MRLLKTQSRRKKIVIAQVHKCATPWDETALIYLACAVEIFVSTFGTKYFAHGI
jgi:hypothetical protein